MASRENSRLGSYSTACAILSWVSRILLAKEREHAGQLWLIPGEPLKETISDTLLISVGPHLFERLWFLCVLLVKIPRLHFLHEFFELRLPHENRVQLLLMICAQRRLISCVVEGKTPDIINF